MKHPELPWTNGQREGRAEASYPRPPGGFGFWAGRDRRYTYAIYRRDKSERLFDNQGDPLQMQNECL